MGDIIKYGLDNGFVETILIVKISSGTSITKYMVRKFGKRLALNAPIQGSANDILKSYDWYWFIHSRDNLKSKILQAWWIGLEVPKKNRINENEIPRLWLTLLGY